MGRELGSALSVALQPIIAHACQPTFKSRAGHHAELFAPRVDDLISGIIQVLKSGGRWIDGAGGLWSAQNTLQSLPPLASEGRMGKHIPRTRNGRWTSCAGPR